MLNQTAEEVTLTFLRHIVLLYGIPQFIVTDQGTQFMSDLFKRLCKLLKLHKLNTTAYHPESNGALERTHKTMVEYLRCFCNPRGTDWHKWLPFPSFVYNTTPHKMTKYTPTKYYLVERQTFLETYNKNLYLYIIMMTLFMM
jgi:transposase InsO family protein